MAVVLASVLYTLGGALTVGGLVGLWLTARRELKAANTKAEAEGKIAQAVSGLHTAVRDQLDGRWPGTPVKAAVDEMARVARETAGLPEATSGANDLTGSQSRILLARVMFHSARYNLALVGSGVVLTLVASLWALTV